MRAQAGQWCLPTHSHDGSQAAQQAFKMGAQKDVKSNPLPLI